MGEMAREFFSDSSLVAAPLVATVLFVSVFVSAVIFAVFAEQKRMDQAARLPFEGEEDAHV